MAESIYDMHIEVLKLMGESITRLHVQIERGDGDTDDAQSQLGNLHEELIRLSQAFSNKECE